MHRPIVWIAAAFAGGIVLGKFTLIGLHGWMLVAAASASAAAILYVRRRQAASATLCAVLAAGGFWYSVRVLPPAPGSVAELAGRDVTLYGTVVRPPSTSPDRLRFVLRAERVTIQNHSHNVSGLVLVSIRARTRPRYGDELTIRGRLNRPPAAGNRGEFSYRDYLAAQGIHVQLVAGRSARVEIRGRRRLNPAAAIAYAVRAHLSEFFGRAMPHPAGALLMSLLLGDDGAIPDDLRETFRHAGLLHVLVVSGAQVGLVAGAILWIARTVGLSPPAGAVAAAIAVIFFALMAGWVPSVGRATIMALAGLAAVLIGRTRDIHAALAAAALALLASSPLLIFDAGFQLSFVATWSLIYAAPALAERMTPLPRLARALIAMTISAQAAVMPVLAVHFAQVSLAGFVANLIVVPLVGVLVPAGFACGLAGLVLPTVGVILAPLLAVPVNAVVSASAFFAGLPAAIVHVSPPSLLVVVLWYLLLAAAVELLRGRVRLRMAGCCIAACGLIGALLWAQVVLALEPSHLRMTFLDVGQGDAIVIRAPSGRTMMIDGGGEIEGHETGYDIGMRRVGPALRRLGLHRIDVLVLSHPHEDHAGGLVAVAENFRVGVMLDSGHVHPAPSYPRLLQVLDARRIPYRLARRGMRVDLGGARAMILHPEDPLISGSGSDANLNSIVLRLTHGQVSALFTGDIEGLVEGRLLETGDELRSNLLKVAHHGSRTSSRPEFLEAVAPQIAVISVGAWNPFGHPHPGTLDALAAAGARIYRTDRHGAVSVETDGRSLWVHTVRDAGDR